VVGAAMRSLIASRTYLANRPGKEVEHARAFTARISWQRASG